MRSRRSQPPAVPDVRTLASRRENGGDLSRNRASLQIRSYTERHSRFKTRSHALSPWHVHRALNEQGKQIYG